jgi:hypothetical protein
MHLHCHLGRIAPVEQDPFANLKGAQNARKWVIDLNLPGEPAQISLKLVDWRTGIQMVDKGKGAPVLRGKLMPYAIALNRPAARATVFFPVAEDGNLTVVVEPEAGDPQEMRFRLVADAPNTLAS